MGLLASAVMLVALFAYIFWPEETPFTQGPRTRLDFLEERRVAVMNNLRDLSFEHRAGKYPEQDYAVQRELLESEAADILHEMDALSETTPHA